MAMLVYQRVIPISAILGLNMSEGMCHCKSLAVAALNVLACARPSILQQRLEMYMPAEVSKL